MAQRLWYSSLHRAPFRFCGSHVFISCRWFLNFFSLDVLLFVLFLSFFFSFSSFAALSRHTLGTRDFFSRVWWGYWAVPWCLPQADISLAKRPEGTTLQKPYRYVPPHRVGFLSRFGLKTGIHYTLCPFWSGIMYGFRGNHGVYERIYRFNSKWVRKKEKYENSKWIGIIFFCLR